MKLYAMIDKTNFMEELYMALINCPEGGKEISDKAVNCPNCAFPIAAEKPSGEIWIKIFSAGIVKFHIIDAQTGRQIWGEKEQLARFYLDKPTQINILGGFGSKIVKNYTIDPKVSNKYALKMMGMGWQLNPVDFIDAD